MSKPTLSLADQTSHARLRSHPVFFSSLGVLHTLLTAGIVFGWASLLPILRREHVALSPASFARVFTHGAIGNYLSSLPFGLLLDRFGPRACGVFASALFAAGCFLCSLARDSPLALDAGFTLLGFAGPAVQLPTLHLARLFPGEAREGGSGGAALMMSAQAGAFDGGTFIFFLFAAVADTFSVSSSAFFRVYMLVPLCTLLTAIFIWPDTILPDAHEKTTITLKRTDSYLGRMAYLNAAVVDDDALDRELPITAAPEPTASAPPAAEPDAAESSLKDVPLRVLLSQPHFYCLALWVSVHILKLNFVVATINDQLRYSFPGNKETAGSLIDMFGALLPFGFVILPLVAFLLTRPMICFQLANAIGLVYGAIITFLPSVAPALVLGVFAPVATSRQLVYSTVFHQTGELFGFSNYGVMLGLINVMVSAVSLLQNPLVDWAESSGGYYGANCVLLAFTVPLVPLAFFTSPNATLVKEERQEDRKERPSAFVRATEETRLIPRHVPRPRRGLRRSIYSDIIFLS